MSQPPPQPPQQPNQPPWGGGFGPPPPMEGPPAGPPPVQPAPPQPYGYAQPPPSGGGWSGARIALVVFVCLAVIFGSGGIAYVLTKDDSGPGESRKKDEDQQQDGDTGGQGKVDAKPGAVDAQRLFSAPYPEIKNDRTVPVRGQWATEKIYAKSEVDEIAGYDAVSGKEAWRIPLEGGVCGASKDISADGKVALLIQEHVPVDEKDYPPCSRIAVIDVGAGKKLWDEGGDSEERAVSFSSVTLSQGTVAASGIGGSVAYPLDGGKPLWEPDPEGDCRVTGFGGGKQLLAVLRCGPYEESEIRVEKREPKSGTAQWTYTAPKGTKYVQMISTDPVVFGITVGSEHSPKDVISLDKEGKLRAKISLGTDNVTGGFAQYDPACETTEVEPCRGAAVDEKYLYLGSQQHRGDAEATKTNEIVAFDLGSGKKVKRFDAGDERTLWPLRMAGEKLLAYRLPGYEQSGEIVAIDPASGQQDVWLRLPAEGAEAERTFSPKYAAVTFAYGRLYLGELILSQGSGLSSDYLFLAFGSK